jgi:hypothetical protein
MKCGLCGEVAVGYATINGVRFCHDDYTHEPSCYMKAQWEMGLGTERVAL